MKTLMSCATALILTFSLNVASAALIDVGSEIGLIGNFTPSGGSGLADATDLSFDDATVIIGSNDFAGQVGGAASLANLSLTGPLPAGAFLTTSGGLTFTMTSLTVALQTDSALDWSATGFWSLAGFEDTPGTMVWTGDSLGGLFTSSAAGNAVIPLPAAVWLFASILPALGLFRRRTA